MNPFSVGQAIDDYGVSVGVLILCIIFLVYLVRWVLRETSDREKRLTNIIENHQEHIVTTLTQACATMKQVQEASEASHQHQQDQHEKMISCLDRMKGRMAGVSG